MDVIKFNIDEVLISIPSMDLYVYIYGSQYTPFVVKDLREFLENNIHDMILNKIGNI
jgi:hypothetical protein